MIPMHWSEPLKPYFSFLKFGDFDEMEEDSWLTQNRDGSEQLTKIFVLTCIL